MNTIELFNGIAVVIDDEINDEKANIRDILNQIEQNNVPCLTYQSIPSDEIIKNFNNLSFLLLDWKLNKDIEGVKLPQELRESYIEENLDFIKNFLTVCYCPIFIFTNEEKNSIIMELEQAGILFKNRPSYILIKSKSEIIKGKGLFNEIDSWITSNPSVYVLKEWEREYQESKNRLFSEFHNLCPIWPKIMWDNFSYDGANKSLELGELISRNLQTRMLPFNFSDDILSSVSNEVEQSEIALVLEGERYLKNTNFHNENDICTGDLFREETESGDQEYRYFLNIRAQCDLVRNPNPELYCLRGRIIQKEKINGSDGISFENGQFIEKISHAIIPCLDNGKIIEFLFNDLKIKKWNSLKEKRIGRLLPPYINRIQQRFALYLQRQGLPRIPNIIVFDNNNR